MYYVIPAKAANAALAKKFIDFAESPEIQADGIVKQFNWYPGIDPQHVQAKLTPAAWNKLFTDISPARPREERPAVPAVGLLHRHRRRVRARRAEVAVRSGTGSASSSVSAAGVHRRAAAARRGRWRATRWSRPRSPSSSLFFVMPLGISSAVLAFRAKDGSFTLRALREVASSSTAPTSLHDRRSSLLSSVLIGARRDRHRRLPDARREPARRGDPALALSLAAVHPVHRHRPGDARRSSPRTGC